MRKTRFLLLTGLILIAAIARILPHPPNVTPIAAMALFGGAYFNQKKFAIIIPMIAMLAADIFLGFHSTMLFVYGAFLATIGIGFLLRSNKSVFPIAGAAVGSSVLFFVVTNFGVWLSTGMYPMTVSGLISCYVAGIPFFQNTLLGDLVFTGVLFGAFEFLKQRYPSLNTVKAVSK